MAGQDLTAGAVVDVSAALTDPAVRPWVWDPFGSDDRQRREAIESACIAAEFECAVVESVQPTEQGQVIVYTDQINLTVPATYRFAVQEQSG